MRKMIPFIYTLLVIRMYITCVMRSNDMYTTYDLSAICYQIMITNTTTGTTTQSSFLHAYICFLFNSIRFQSTLQK